MESSRPVSGSARTQAPPSAPDKREWRNGRRTWLRTRRPQGRESSSLSSRTNKDGWQSGRLHSLGKRENRKVPRVRIAHRPPGSWIGGRVAEGTCLESRSTGFRVASSNLALSAAGVAQWQSGALPTLRRGVRFSPSAPILLCVAQPGRARRSDRRGRRFKSCRTDHFASVDQWQIGVLIRLRSVVRSHPLAPNRDRGSKG